MITNGNMRDVLQLNGIFKPTPRPVYCRHCGTRLKAYYAEKTVYLVKCGYCEYVGIVSAENPTEAAKHFGMETDNQTEKGGAE